MYSHKHNKTQKITINGKKSGHTPEVNYWFTRTSSFYKKKCYLVIWSEEGEEGVGGCMYVVERRGMRGGGEGRQNLLLHYFKVI